jgi:hypothetical protein
MRALAFCLLFAPLCGQADIIRNSRELNEGEKASLLKLAKETCDPSVIEVSGFTHMWPEETKVWEAHAHAYMAPLKSKADICKSAVCAYRGSKPDAAGKKAPTEFAWENLHAGEFYRVWLPEGGECRGNPSSKIALLTAVEENTLRSLLDQRWSLAEQGRTWLRKSRPDAQLFLDEQVGELEVIEVAEFFGGIRYRLQYGGENGLSVYMSTAFGQFVIEEAGLAARP